VAHVRVGVNGAFGSIGRRFLRASLAHPDVEVVALNDLGDPAAGAHYLKYDSNYGQLDRSVELRDHRLVLDGHEMVLTAHRSPGEIPWGDLGVDVVVEATGLFTDGHKARAHITGGGAKKVIISAPADHDDVTIVLGVNEDQYRPDRDQVISNASCTTNCLAPVAKVLDERFGIRAGVMTTAHSYTNDQRLLDLAHRDLRKGRAAADNIIPTSTGAARAIHRVLPQLEGKMHGISLRVPTPVVSVVDLAFTAERELSIAAINEAFEQAAAGAMGHYLAVSDLPLVSSDFKGNPHSSIVDLPLTMVVGELGKVVAWYDNEWGYSNRLVELAAYIAERGLSA
jgi:glyceraldehyde 3-phosphate dehydrogenase